VRDAEVVANDVVDGATKGAELRGGESLLAVERCVDVARLGEKASESGVPFELGVAEKECLPVFGVADHDCAVHRRVALPLNRYEPDAVRPWRAIVEKRRVHPLRAIEPALERREPAPLGPRKTPGRGPAPSRDPSPKTPTPPMALPQPARPAATKQLTKAQKPGGKVKDSAESSSEFDKRMAKLAQEAEARQAEEALARMRDKIRSQGAGRPGMPAGSGTQAGSDYLAYLQSRLKDAFQNTISYTSKKPEMTVRLFVDTDGKLSRKKIERSNGDRAFEISVFRAIDTASEKFTPPPGRKVFEGVFVFRPEGISQTKP